MDLKRIVLVAVACFGLLSVPVANADVVVRYIVVDDGNSYREPFNSHGNRRLYPNTYRQGVTRSDSRRYRDSYRDRCEDERYYNPPQQYRNNYYYGHRDRYQSYRHNGDKGRRNYGYHRDAPHAQHKYDNRGGRVHININ